jgi:hypothetical protein
MRPEVRDRLVWLDSLPIPAMGGRCVAHSPCSLSAATRVSRTLCPPARSPHTRPPLRLVSRLYDEDSSR